MRALKIYFAGDLFDSKDLGGNLMLSGAVEKKSGGRFQVMLPQNGECEVTDRTAQSIRDADFQLLYSCDVIVANFDGTDLDSGTVVEFCFAKMVDMPAVLLRTDFRHGGDQALGDGDPWNLMCSHYPRTKVLHLNSMVFYHQSLKETSTPAECLEHFYNSIAQEIVEALDQAVSQKSWLEREQVLPQYQRALKSVGGSVEKLLQDDLEKIVRSKINAGVY